MKTALVYRSREGDRWDLIAWRYYHDLAQIPALLQANPTLPVTPVLQAGWTVLIPIIEASAVTDSELPPWRR